MKQSRFAIADELMKLIGRITGIFRQHARTKQQARFWSDVREGQEEAATSAAVPGDPGPEETLRHRRREV